MPKHDQKSTAIHIRGVPVDLRQRFKIYCAQQNISMTEAFIKLLELAIAKELKLEK